eukprot:UN00820
MGAACCQFGDNELAEEKINAERALLEDSSCPPGIFRQTFLKHKFVGFGAVKPDSNKKSVVLNSIIMIGAICGGDGIISDVEKEFVIKQFESYGIENNVIIEQLNKSQDIKNVDEAIKDLLKMAGTPYKEEYNWENEETSNRLLMIIFTTALNAASSDGFHQTEIETAYDIGSKLNIDKKITQNILSLMQFERELYDGWDKVFQ